MPRPTRTLTQKSLKTVCVDTVLFFALFALVGHLTINFWERYTIQTELSTMKNSLHTLKDTITNIGKAYDSLHTELKDLFKIVDKKQTKMQLLPQCIRQKELETNQCKNKNNLDRRTLHDIQVQAVLTKPNKVKVGVGTVTDDRLIELTHYENKLTGPLSKNVATNTKNPPKSTGISSDTTTYETEKCHHQNNSRCNHEYRNHLKCYRDFEHCRHICNHKNS